MNPLYKRYFDNSTAYKGGNAAAPKEGQKIYKLSSNENMLGCSPKVKDVLSRSLDHLHVYPAPSDVELRIKIANLVGEGFSERNIITGNGGVNIIQVALHAFLDHDLECIVPSPSFIPYFGMPTQVNARVISIPLRKEDFSIDVDKIIEAVTPLTRVICLASPNNPTGSIITQTDLDKLIDHIPEHVLVIYDEVYQQYVTDPLYGRPAKHILDGKPIIALNSFSKAYGLAGLRVGYAYTSLEVADYLQHFLRPFHINRLSQAAAMTAIEDQEFISEVVELTTIEKEYLYTEFDQLNLQYWKSEANFILIKPKSSAIELEEQLFKHGIMVRSGDAFQANGHIRITIGDREANKALIGALKLIL